MPLYRGPAPPTETPWCRLLLIKQEAQLEQFGFTCVGWCTCHTDPTPTCLQLCADLHLTSTRCYLNVFSAIPSLCRQVLFPASLPHVDTFHSFNSKILKSDINYKSVQIGEAGLFFFFHLKTRLASLTRTGNQVNKVYKCQRIKQKKKYYHYRSL